MKYGVFLPNGSNGYIISRASPVYVPTYEHNLAVTLEAERQGLDFVLSMMKYRGFGGEVGFWDECLETFTLMAALAANTSRIGLFPSVTLLAHHPAIVARMIATIDDVSGGRCGLNIVTGWNKPEYTQMGVWRGDEYYDQRYEYAREYLTVLKTLWRDGRVTHRGRFVTIEDCVSLPRPKHEIPIVCAGMSPKGIEFTAELGDHNFVMCSRSQLTEIVRNVKATSARHGRNPGTYALFHVISAPTDAEADAQAEAILAGADPVAIGNMIASAQLDTNRGGTSDLLKSGLAKSIDEGNMAFLGIPVVRGSYRRVAAELDAIAEQTGVDGILFSFPDFVQGIRDFGEKVAPHLTTAKPTGTGTLFGRPRAPAG
ncbi:MAG: LLM class flavin-dependent oxidoreductase [Steroidobacteraceae bacterium]|nr:LLM class flavin-dependent oxidoreductase [Steroidobacteraceae bacterium]